MVLKRLKLCLFFSLFFAHTVAAQPYYFKHFEVEDGLSNNSVINSLQDRKGFLWFGTPDGLNRYDGKNFKIFKDYGRQGDLKSNAVYYLHEDSTGVLWIGTEKGMFRFDEHRQEFELVSITAGKTIRAIQNDGRGGLWIAEESAIVVYYPANKSFKYFAYDFLKGATSLAKSNDGIIWIGCRNNKLVSYDTNKNLFRVFILGSKNNLSTIEKILPTTEGSLLIGTSALGLVKFNRNTESFSEVKINATAHEKLFVRDILEHKAGEYWVATESGLYVYNNVTKKSVILKKRKENPYTISDNAVYSICRDKEGGIWAGTYFGGINYYSNPQIVFEKSLPGVDPSFISGNVVRRITEDRLGDLWIGTEDAGMSRFNPATGTFENFVENKFNIPSTNIHGLLADGDELYVGTFEHGLYIVNLLSGKANAHFSAGERSVLKSNYVNAILKRSQNDILIGTSNGLYSLNKKSNQLSLFNGLPLDQFYSALAEGPNRTAWAGTHSQGIFFIDSTNAIYNFVIKSGNGKNDLLKDTRILNLYFDNLNNFWISTESGLYFVNTHNGKAELYDYTKGFPSNIVYTVVQDKQNNYWATTSKGLVRIDYANHAVKVFRKSDGLLTEQFNHHSSFVDNDGYIYFGSLKGLVRFNPINYRESKFIAPIYANEIKLFSVEENARLEEKQNQYSLLQNSSVTLPFQYASFSINFSILSFKSPDNIKFAYKLQPVDQNWNYIGQNNVVNFTNLAPGQYELKVKSSNSGGLWLPNEKVVSITITPPFWRSKWAYLLYVLASIVLFVLASLYLIQRNKRKNRERMAAFAHKKEKELYEAKFDFYTNVAHEIKTPLSLIKAPLEKIRQNTEPTPLVSKYMDIVNKNTERLLELSTQLLDLRKLESDNYHLNFDKINIVELVKYLFTNFQTLADDRKIIYKIESVQDVLFVNADEEALKKIITNLLDNAIKYSQRSVNVTIEKTSDSIANVRFANDGILISQEESEKIFEPFYRSKTNIKVKGSGVGLSLANSLAKLNHGNIEYRIEKNQNIFIFSLPEFSND